VVEKADGAVDGAVIDHAVDGGAAGGKAAEGRAGNGGQGQTLSGRERVVRSAYDLFSRHGTRSVGVDTVIAHADVAKMTLYRNFASKDDLILAFLQRREELWTNGWLAAEATRRGETPAEQLLAIFDVFSEWFARPDFEGCSFITVLLEVADSASPVREASIAHLAEIRSFLRGLASAAGIADADGFARQWHILMKGSIIAAHEGDELAGKRAQEVGRLLLAHYGVKFS
jgi:AcrR family transcriptional regulator